MSGRLVILRHKSWHVWNQDNREKVMRDKRLHEEEKEDKRKKQNISQAEKNLEILRRDIIGDAAPQESNSKLEIVSINESKDDESSSNLPLERFTLFDESHMKKLNAENELKREKLIKEKLLKKQNGVAEWALGDGSVELSKKAPWYEKKINLENDNTSVDPLKQDKFKSKLDPSNSFMSTSIKKESHHNKYTKNIDNKTKFESNKRSSSNTLNSEYIEKDNKRQEHVMSDNSSNKAGYSVAEDSFLLELRKKRLAREAVEKKRAELLVANADIYGPQSSHGNNTYRDQQYNPHLIKSKQRK
eukprot:gene5670-7827_t